MKSIIDEIRFLICTILMGIILRVVPRDTVDGQMMIETIYIWAKNAGSYIEGQLEKSSK